jgi:hypothetical protein
VGGDQKASSTHASSNDKTAHGTSSAKTNGHGHGHGLEAQGQLLRARSCADQRPATDNTSQFLRTRSVAEQRAAANQGEASAFVRSRSVADQVTSMGGLTSALWIDSTRSVRELVVLGNVRAHEAAG